MEDNNNNVPIETTENPASQQNLPKNQRSSHESNSLYSTHSKFPFIESNKVENYKKGQLKKVIIAASIDGEVKKALKRLLELGPTVMDEKVQNMMISKAEAMMEEDQVEEVADLVARITKVHDMTYDTILALFKLYIISTDEKKYIRRIEEEIMESVKLEEETFSVNGELDIMKEKRNKSKAIQDSADALRKEIELYENKIEKANIRLNESITNNEHLREKVDHLRHGKALIKKVHQRMEDELETRQSKIEGTILRAGDAYISRTIAEQELQQLYQKSSELKEKFTHDLKTINAKIHEDKEFQKFVFKKNQEKKDLDYLEEAIVRNQKKIDEKIRSNAMLENEYNVSAKKEEEIRVAFEKLRQSVSAKTPQDVVQSFNGLAHRVHDMNNYVDELNQEINYLAGRRTELKQKLTSYNLKGVRHDKNTAKEAEELFKKMDEEEIMRKRHKTQYRKYIDILSEHKDKIEQVFEAIGADEKLIAKVKANTFTEQNIQEFIGRLEEQGMELINKFSVLIGEQLKIEEFGQEDLDAQIDDLNNIVAYNNANFLTTKVPRNSNVSTDIPDDLVNTDGGIDKDVVMTEEQFRQTAYSIINTAQKKQLTSSPRKTLHMRNSQFYSRASIMKGRR